MNTDGAVHDLDRLVRERTAELAAERTRLRAVLENIPSAVVMVASVDDWATRVRGFRRDGSEVGRDEWPLVRAMRDGVSVVEELVIERPDGHRIWVDARAAPVRDDDGNITAGVAIVDDASDRHTRERVEREFVTNAAHELRTPVAAIAAAVEVLQSGAKEIAEDRDRFLGHIERATQRLARLGRALLTLARAQTGQERPKHELVQLCSLLHDVAAVLEPGSDLHVEVDCPADLATVTHPELLEQALTNLAQNAVKHTREGGVVLSARADDGEVVIEVSDTGSGMAPVHEVHVFDRFYRGDAADGFSDEGFGLGLTIAAESVRALGGRLDLQPLAGGGTRARISVPYARLVSA